MRYTMPAKLKAISPESMYSMRRQSPSLLRLRLYIVLKNELRPTRLRNSTKNSYFWRKCRRQLAALYLQKYNNQPPICPIYFAARLPPKHDAFSLVEAWAKKHPAWVADCNLTEIGVRLKLSQSKNAPVVMQRGADDEKEADSTRASHL